MSNTTMLKDYEERIVPALEKQFKYTTVMQVPRLEKIVINQGTGHATQDKQLIDIALLASGQLKGEALAKFVNRSVELL